MSKKVIKPNEHVFIGGRTGTGKTWLAKKYLTNYEFVVALDTKGMLVQDWTEPGPKELTVVTRLADLEKVKTPKIIYQPTWDEMTFDHYNAFFFWIYQRRNTIVWIDEAMSVCPNPMKIPDGYRACLTRGRQLNIGVWSLSQRPSGLPQVILSEATHFFVFDLSLPQDREKLVEITGAVELYEMPSKHGKYVFWYYKVGEERAVLGVLRERKG